MALQISNRQARALWLNAQGLADAPTGKPTTAALMESIRGIGFVQLDTIRVVARAHDHILWSRNQNYREKMMGRLLTDERAVFEHFTHDASVLPMEFYPMWRRQFERMRMRMEKGAWAKAMPPRKEIRKIRDKVEQEGSLCTRDFEGKADKSKHAWARPPHKYALDYLWYAGELSTCHRRNFIKYYNLSERIIPVQYRQDEREDEEQLDWLCKEALSRLGFASEGEIMRFWDAADLAEVKDWATQQSDLVEVEVKTADRNTVSALAPADIEIRLKDLKAPTSRLRIINPFDPAVRDRDRLQRLFGFDYRIEIFVPAAKRQYGYYVYPILEGDRFTGRIEVRADRKKGTLTVENLWWEKGVKTGKGRLAKLHAELDRMARFIGVGEIIWLKGARV